LGLVGRARRIAHTAAYVAHVGSEGGEIRLEPGDPAVTARLRQILRVPETASPPPGALAVFSVAPGQDAGAVARQMAERARDGERSVAVIIGRSAQRASAERALMATGDIEMSSIAHVAALDERGDKEVIDGVIRAVGSKGLVAAARRNPALREQASRRVLRRDARAAGILASGALGTQAHMANLTNRQVRMLGDLAAIRDRNLGREDAVDVAAVAGSGFAWRIVGRNAARASGRPMLARSVVAWAVTRGMGMVSERRLTSDQSYGRTLDLDKLKGSAGTLVGRLKSLREGRKS
jgi:hypothetical protein